MAITSDYLGTSKTRYPIETDTLRAATDRFTALGYKAGFHVDGDKLVSSACPTPHDPEDMIVEDFRRFEGATDPDDESVVFALRCCPHGTRGLYVASYGPLASPEDQDVILRLSQREHSSDAAAASGASV